jgi:hypothetical protein
VAFLQQKTTLLQLGAISGRWVSQRQKLGTNRKRTRPTPWLHARRARRRSKGFDVAPSVRRTSLPEWQHTRDRPGTFEGPIRVPHLITCSTRGRHTHRWYRERKRLESLPYVSSNSDGHQPPRNVCIGLSRPHLQKSLTAS